MKHRKHVSKHCIVCQAMRIEQAWAEAIGWRLRMREFERVFRTGELP